MKNHDLTPSQWRLVEDYMPLAKSIGKGFMNSKPVHVSTLSLESIFDAAKDGLVDAARRYDPSKGVRFATFSRPRIAWHIIDEMRREKFRPHMLNVSRVFVSTGDGCGTVDLSGSAASIPVEESGFRCVDDRDEATFLLGCLPSKHRRVVELWMHGAKQSEIAAVVGVSQSRVNAILKQSFGFLKHEHSNRQRIVA